MGHLISAGTGLSSYKHLVVEPPEGEAPIPEDVETDEEMVSEAS